MRLPSNLRPYLEEAQKLLKNGCVGDLEFSHKTYQVQVFENTSERGFWAFLQLNDKRTIEDAFCSCSEGEGCVHLTAAFLSLYRNHKRPLHIRFQESLWNALGHLFEQEVLMKKGEGGYATEEGAFEIGALDSTTRSHLEELIAHRIKETEETSLKFSNLSQQELQMWREGKPCADLRYELSYWADIAKWLMQLQDKEEPYSIAFEGELPLKWKITFPQVELRLKLNQEQLAHLIPSLSSVKSPLKIHTHGASVIEKVTFEPETGLMRVFTSGEKCAVSNEKGVSIDGWVYVLNDGFYPRQRSDLFGHGVLSGNEISLALNEHFSVLKEAFQGEELHEESISLHYALHFDPHWNLQITALFETEGDLTQGNARLFGEWVYIPEKGFYHIIDREFQELELVIPADHVTHFIRKHRIWLNAQEGFHTFVSRVESEYTYEVEANGDLVLKPKLEEVKVENRVKDFGSWVYVEGEGFYAKRASSLNLPDQAVRPIPQKKVEKFLKEFEEELHLIKGFFLENVVVQEPTLMVNLGDDGKIHVSPDYGIPGKITYYGSFLYIEGKGFCSVYHDRGLPERFRNPFTVEEKDVAHFLYRELPQIAAVADPRLHFVDPIKFTIERLELLDGGYVLKGSYGKVPATDLWLTKSQKKRFHFSESGVFDLEEPEFKWMGGITPKMCDRRSRTFKLSTIDLIRLTLTESVQSGGTYQPLIDDLMSFSTPEPPLYDELKGSLRPYQEKGLMWLWFLYTHKLSGLLCDDMGLGKTHQVMALIAAMMQQHHMKKEETIRHFMVICPTSVIYHWEDKIKEHLPHVRVCTFHGSKRSLKDFKKDYDLLLTSYGVWRNEHKNLTNISFELAVFDELQLAKNEASKLHKSMKLVESTMRVGLTGTPIENALSELRALFDLVIPGYMPSEKVYLEQYVKPIQEKSDVQKRAELTRMIRPFLLRRKKEQVLEDLPEKTEEISHCELSDEQQRLYKDLLSQARGQILHDLRDESRAVPYLHVFSLLSQLKQICNHPAAYHKCPLEYSQYSSGKWDLFCELLSEARGSSQKVVVFSQYLAMLDIIEAYLKERGISFGRLRGDTVDRGAQIKRFNTDPNCVVFVGSLRAAGLGVDLTAASVVIHYDRWWNAAREDQATDRVHRIGQTRGVQVFKLVTKDTFEEKIDAMITRKGKLMEDVVGSDDHRIVKHFTRNELISLLT